MQEEEEAKTVQQAVNEILVHSKCKWLRKVWIKNFGKLILFKAIMHKKEKGLEQSCTFKNLSSYVSDSFSSIHAFTEIAA